MFEQAAGRARKYVLEGGSSLGSGRGRDEHPYFTVASNPFELTIVGATSGSSSKQTGSDLRHEPADVRTELEMLLPENMTVSRAEMKSFNPGSGLLFHASPRDDSRAHPSFALFLWQSSVALVAFVLAALPIRGGDSSNVRGPTSDEGSLLSRRISQIQIPALPLGDFIHTLRTGLGLHIHMESIIYDYDKPETFVTVAEEIDRMRRTAQRRPLSAAEECHLKHLEKRGMAPKADPETDCLGVRYRRLVSDEVADTNPVVLRDTTVKQLLDELVSRDPDYSWEFLPPETIHVIPKGTRADRYASSMLNWKFPKVQSGPGPAPVPLRVFLGRKDIRAVFAEHGVSASWSGWLNGDEPIRVNIPEGTISREALSLIASGVGRGCFWYLHRAHYSRSNQQLDLLTYNTVPSLDMGKNDAEVAHLAKCSGTTKLDLTGWVCLTDAGLAHLEKCSGLRELVLPAQITDKGLSHLAALASLTALDLRRCAHATDAGFARLRGLPALRTLCLPTQATNRALASLADLRGLTTLNLRGNRKVTGEGLQYLTRAKGLRTLSLCSSRVGDADLLPLRELTRLRWVSLSSTNISDAGLAHLKGMTALQTLELDSCRQITDSGLAHLSSLTGLVWLGLGSPRISDAGLRHLSGLKRLNALRFRSCDQITDAGLMNLTSLTGLRDLTLRNCKRVTEKGLETLKSTFGDTRVHYFPGDTWTRPAPGHRFDSALSLSICAEPDCPAGGTPLLGSTPTQDGAGVFIPAGTSWFVWSSDKSLTDQGLKALAEDLRDQPNVGLRIWSRSVTDAGLECLKTLPHLERLDFCPLSKQITDAGIENVKALTNLRRLSLPPRVTDSGLAHVSSLTGLETLSLSDCDRITDNGLAHLRGLTGLKMLNLAGCWKITDAGLVHLRELKQLEWLFICGAITDAGLAELTGLTNLTRLCIEGGKIAEAGFAYLKRLRRLRRLYLCRCTAIPISAFAHLGELPQLTSLRLVDVEILDESLAAVARLQGLRELQLMSCTKLTDAGLASLAALKDLRTLDLRGCSQITDGGLRHLAKMTGLTKLELYQCPNVTDDGVQKLKSALPKLQVNR